MDARTYAMQLSTAQRRYRQTQDYTAYLIDCLYVAATFGADALAEENPRFAYLAGALSVASPAFKAALATVADYIGCPVEGNQSPEDFLRTVSRHARHYIDRDYAVVGKIMAHMGI